MRIGLLCIAGLLWSLFAHAGGTATNEATDPGGGSVTLLSSGQISITAENTAVTSATAEIDPTTVPASSTGITYTYDVLPTINPGNTGVDQIVITAPAGHGALIDAGVAVGGSAQTASGSCPAPAAGEYCATIAGPVMTIRLGSKVTVTGTNIKIRFNADAPGGLGSGNFTSTVDDSGTATVAAQTAGAGNADGDAADANSQTVTVLPQVSFTAAAQSGAENAGTLTITAQLSTVSAQNVSVPFTLGGTANDPADYGITASPIVITAGSLSAAITLTVADDALVESGETVIVTLGTPTNALAGGTTVHSATITDNDSAGVTVTQSGGNTAITEGGASDSYNVVLTSEPSADVVIAVTPDAQSDLGAGAATAINLTFTNANWNTPQTVTVTAVDDALAEGAHTSTITHGAASGDANYQAIAIANVTAAITDNDLTGITVTQSSGNTAVSEGGASDSYSVVLNTAPAANVVITVTPDAQSDLGAGAATAINLTFTPGDWNVAQTITVTAVDDVIAEGAHTSTLTHSAASADANYHGIAIANVVANIADNDTAQISFAAASANGAEAVTTLPINITLSLPSSQVITVDYRVDAASTATGGVDYTLANGTLSFNAGETSKDITLAVNDDALNELNETVVINLSNAVNAALGGIAQHSYTLVDDDPMPSVAFANATSNAGEASASANLTVTLSAASGQNVAIDYSVDPASTATGGGVDYTLANGTLTFNAGETSQDITLSLSNDNLIEGDESVVINLSNPLNAVLGASAQHSLIIVDDDASNAVSGAVADISPIAVPVNTPGVPFTVTLTPTINPGDSGIDLVSITLPGAYSNLTPAAVGVGGVSLSPACPAPAAGQFCASVSGQTLTVILGEHVTTDATPIIVRFSADTPAAIGSGSFVITVDDSQTATPAQSVGFGSGGAQVRVVLGVDPLASTVTAQPLIVVADGVRASTLTATLFDTSGAPVAGKDVVFDSDRGALDSFVQVASPTGADGVARALLRSTRIGAATLRGTVSPDNIALLKRPTVYFTQGRVLDITKLANKDEVVIGDVVTYTLIIKNLTDKDVLQVKLHDALPPDFKYLPGSTRVNGAPAPDPAGHRPLLFDLGTLAARVDSNGNGVTDSTEAGYTVVSYQLIVGAGATPRDYVNTVYALDVCELCFISNNAEVTVSVSLDPAFDLGTLIGKVYQDPNRNGKQDKGEAGVSGAMVVLDDGSYALTDEHGRYHFPAVTPGPRALKINLQALAAGAESTTGQISVVNITPGLLAKANFGVIYRYDSETIGRAEKLGLRAETDVSEKPATVHGSVEMLSALINGYPVALPSGDVKLGLAAIEDHIHINNGSLAQPLRLTVKASHDSPVAEWFFTISDAKQRVVRSVHGAGAPPALIEWDARDERGDLLAGGEIYQYQLEIRYADGGLARSPRRMVGVNRSSAISVNLTGSAFELGSARLSPAARQTLSESAVLLRRFPEEKIVIEGHTDSLGKPETNLRLSQERAEAAANYLINEEGIPSERLVVHGFGSERPMASNALPEGREMNRRVELKGLVGKVENTDLTDQFRGEPAAVINGASLPLQAGGLFQTQIDPATTPGVDIQLTGAQGGSSRAVISVPSLNLPAGEIRIPYGAHDDEQGYYAEVREVVEHAQPDDIIIGLRLNGHTDAGNIVQIDDSAVPVAADGRFAADLKLKQGVNYFSLMVRNAANFTRVVDVQVKVGSHQDDGALLLLVQAIPRLTVKFPPKDAALTSPLLVVSGNTDSANRLTVNGVAVPVQDDGRFTTTLTLPTGHSSIEVKVADPAGNEGGISRDIEVRDSKLFLLAFADGKIGQLQGKGYVQGAGLDSASQFYSEGRIAYYLKGMVAGKYLITSAFDSGTHELGELFNDLDRAENDRLLTNLDPDKLYPVYGDNSTVVYDSQSRGKFYLAVDSDELDAVIGNYPVSLTGSELASYQRTLFGGRLAYQSLARSQYGDPDTEAVIFTASVRQVQVRDELRTTGGSLYYLSHGDIIEGSEQVTLVVRDKDTGLVLSRQPQQQNTDYTIQYGEGRLLFNRPLASIQADGRLIDRALLGGNPVSIEVAYETDAAMFEKHASGGRLRKQLGQHVAVGGTYVQDELAAGRYQLQGLDTEIRLGQGTRLQAELAQSEGSDGQTYFSDDGGLTFRDTTPLDSVSGQAWKLAAEVDIGEWFGRANRYRMGAYMKRLEPGFISNGNTSEISSEKSGLNLSLQVSERDKVLLRQDQETSLSAAGASENNRTTAQLQHQAERWSVTGEYQQTASSNAASGINDSSMMAAELRLRVTEQITATLEQQFTLSGPDNDQTRIGLDYRVNSRLSLRAKGIQGSLGQAAELGAEFNLGGKRLYLTQRLTNDANNHELATTVVGAQSPLGRSGKLYSEYQWEQNANSERNVSLLGAERNWQVRRGLQLLLAGELGQVQAAGGDSDRYAVAGGLSYSHPRGVSASTRNELRRESGAREREQFLTTNHAELKLNPDYTLLGKYRYSTTRDLMSDSVEAEFEESSVGMAYRPVAHDRFNALARYTRQADQRPLTLGAVAIENTSRDIASIEWSWQLTPQLEWVDKLALRMKEEQAGDRPAVATTTFLSISRLNYRIRPRIDLGAEYRLLSQQETQDQRQGWATELSWHVLEHARVGGGYNFTDFSDSEFSDNDYSVHGWFLRLQGTY